MNAWFETIGVMLVAGVGVVVGRWFSGLRKPFWPLGSLLPLVVVIMLGVALRMNCLMFIAPFSWVVAGRIEFVLIGLTTSMMLTTPLAHLEQKRLKVLICIFMGIMVLYYSVMPFFFPILSRSELEQLETYRWPDGVCMQTTDYTCGPAAAVTALWHLGIKAEEGELAILAHTSRYAGTAADILCSTMEDKYGEEGVSCQYRAFDSIEQLREAGLTIVVVKFSFFVDHYITVLEVTDEKVIAVDPLAGEKKMSYDEFREIWRYCGIVVKRNQRIEVDSG